MNSRNWLILLVLTFFLLFCDKQGTSISEVSEKERVMLQKAGSEISGLVLKNLKTALTGAIAEGGPIHAISFCNLRALPLTAEIEKQSGGQIEIRRTSYLYRNRLNAPDEAESIALDHFTSLAGKSMPLPEVFMQKVTNREGTYFNYYQPIMIGGLCLTCHGEKEHIDPQVSRKLAELYPGDKATGYKTGDFRGLLRVRVSDTHLTAVDTE